jgi:hypothetical protein
MLLNAKAFHSFLNSLLYLKGKYEIKEITFEEKNLNASLRANES